MSLKSDGFLALIRSSHAHEVYKSSHSWILSRPKHLSRGRGILPSLKLIRIFSRRSYLKTVSAADARYLSTEVATGFTGVYFGLYATGNGERARSPAHFGWFDYTNQPG